MMILESINFACEDRSRGGAPGVGVRPVFLQGAGEACAERIPIPAADDENVEQRRWERLKRAAVARTGGPAK